MAQFTDLNIHLVLFGVCFLLKWIHRHLPECCSSFFEMSLSHFYTNCDFVTVMEVFSHPGFTGVRCHLMSSRVEESYFKWGGKGMYFSFSISL